MTMEQKSIPSFPDRKKSWENRKNITKDKQSFNDSDFTTKYETDPDIHPEEGILKVEKTVQEFLRGLNICTTCKNDDAKKLERVNLDSDLYVIRCLDCDNYSGVDDTTSVYEVKDIVNSWKAKLCDCGNSDLQEYTYEEDEANGRYFLCQKCKKKHAIKQEESESNVDNSQLRAKCVCCDNNDKDTFTFHIDECEEVIGLRCGKCNHNILLEDSDDYNQVTPENICKDKTTETDMYDEIESSRPLGREEVHSAWDLHEVDHITWWRPEGYWHHALVESVYPETNQVNVIHYNGPSPAGHARVKGKIVEEKLDLDKEKGLLYRLNYSGLCFSAYKTIDNARKRLDEMEYSLINNNCEHFVRWCKTGYKYSGQVCSVFDTANRIGKKISSQFGMKLVKKGIFTFILRPAAASATEATTAAIDGVGSAVAAKTVCDCLGIGAVILIEGISAGRDIYKDYKWMKNGNIKKSEFINVVVRRTSQAVGGSTGAIAGSFAGQAIIPIPVVGGLVGCTLGAIIGHYLGNSGGYMFCSYNREQRTKAYQKVNKAW